MTREECRALWAAEERTFFQGWDFSHLDGRWEEEALPWSYREELEPYLNYRTVLLDMGTGGGEFLLSLNPPRGRTYATEGYPPNVELCRRRLPIHGIELRQVYDDSDLPFDDGMFDLVINRQEAYDADEVRRVLKPGGYFVTQQVGGRNNERLAHFLLPGLPEDLREEQDLDHARRALEERDFTILRAHEAFCSLRFFDVGALVYFARIIEWEFPGFSVEKCFEQLWELQGQLERDGFLESREHRYLLTAQKPE